MQRIPVDATGCEAGGDKASEGGFRLFPPYPGVLLLVAGRRRIWIGLRQGVVDRLEQVTCFRRQHGGHTVSWTAELTDHRLVLQAPGRITTVSEQPQTWTIEHFSQANPQGPGQSDVARLLRLVAETLEDLGEVQVQDLVFHSEVTGDGEDWPSVTVYLHRREGSSD